MRSALSGPVNRPIVPLPISSIYIYMKPLWILLALGIASVPIEAAVTRTAATAVALQGGIATTGRIQSLAVFAHFGDETDLAGRAVPDFAADLFDENLPGSVSHFYREMSRGQFRIDGEALPRWYGARSPASAYVGPAGSFADMAREIVEAVDADVDLGRYDNDGPDGVPNSGDDDGYVDFLFIVVRSAPPGFIVDEATGIARLGLGSDYVSDDASLSGGRVRIRADGSSHGPGGSLQQGRTFHEAVGSMAHEFGHYLQLPDLYDTSALQEDPDPEDESAGIGYWGIMGHGNRGWNEQGGPNPFCSWSLARLGWLGVENAQLSVLSQDRSDVVLGDVNQGGTVYLLPEANSQRYYLVEFRRRGASHYERNLPAEGLLIWRINPLVADNGNEANQLVEVVCADGQFADAGFPLGAVPAPFDGRDNLDFWSADPTYNRQFGGNLGDAGDVWDGVRYTDFWAASNPAAAAGISVTNIRAQGDFMRADLRIGDHRRAGPIAQSQVWNDRIALVGDLQVLPGVRLELADGARVEVGRDTLGTGRDPERIEVSVQGQLVSNVTGRDSVLFTSSASRPAAGDWAGISMGPTARAFLRRTRIEYAQTGLQASGLSLRSDESARGVQVLAIDEVDIQDVSEDGIRLRDIAEPLSFYRLSVQRAGGTGLVVEGPGLTRIDGALFADNAGGGLHRAGGYVELKESRFVDNGLGSEEAANARLGREVFGQVQGNVFSGGIGIDCFECKEIVITENVFVDYRVGLRSTSSRPRIYANEFRGGQLALQVGGSVVPARLDLNVVQGSEWLLQSEARAQVMAANNWWGSDDPGWIESRMSGMVQWKPFLNFDPRAPLDFALSQNYPNPFNSSTVIDYQIGINDPIIGGYTRATLEVRNMAGLLVRRLVDELASPGFYSVSWDGRNDAGQVVASGVYYYELDIGPITQYRKLLFLK